MNEFISQGSLIVFLLSFVFSIIIGNILVPFLTKKGGPDREGDNGIPREEERDPDYGWLHFSNTRDSFRDHTFLPKLPAYSRDDRYHLLCYHWFY